MIDAYKWLIVRSSMIEDNFRVVPVKSEGTCSGAPVEEAKASDFDA